MGIPRCGSSRSSFRRTAPPAGPRLRRREGPAGPKLFPDRAPRAVRTFFSAMTDCRNDRSRYLRADGDRARRTPSRCLHHRAGHRRRNPDLGGLRCRKPDRRGTGGVDEEMNKLINDLGLNVISVTLASAERVAQIYSRWGKGIRPAGLNFGDCFAYDVGKEHGCALLYVGDDFAKTDIVAAA